ncbi:hypothetical protein Emed_000872 [Eimeria media]
MGGSANSPSCSTARATALEQGMPTYPAPSAAGAALLHREREAVIGPSGTRSRRASDALVAQTALLSSPPPFATCGLQQLIQGIRDRQQQSICFALLNLASLSLPEAAAASKQQRQQQQQKQQRMHL